MDKEKKNRVAATLNAVILVLSSYCLFCLYDKGGEGYMEGSFSQCLMHFGVWAQVLLCAACMIFTVSANSGRKLREYEINLKFTAASCAAFQLLASLVFLGPKLGMARVFFGNNIFMNGIIPVLAVVSFVFFDDTGRLFLQQTRWTVIPVALYDVVYAVMVVMKGSWPDIYGLTAGEDLWIAGFFLSLLGTYVMAVMICFAHFKDR